MSDDHRSRRSRSGMFRDVARNWRAVWLRAIGVVLAATGVFLVGFIALLFWFDDVVHRQTDLLLDESARLTTKGWVLLGIEVGLPITVLALLTTAVAMSAVVRLVDDATEAKSTTVRDALAHGLRRSPAVFGAAVLYALTVAALVLAAPVLVVIGLVGLALTPLANLARRHRPTLRWPTTRTLTIVAIPFGAAAVTAVRWSLFLPAAALERQGPRSALRRSGQAVGGRGRRIAFTLVVVIGVLTLIEMAFALAAQSFFGATGIGVVRLLTQLPVVAVPVIVLTLLFREGVPESPANLAVVDPVRRSGAPGVLLQGTSLTVVISLVASTLAFGIVQFATPPAAGADTVMVVDDLGDAADATPGDTVCATATATCTLRAAIDEANALSGEHHTINFGLDGTIFVSATLVVSADVDIDASGRKVVIDGRSCEACADPKPIFQFPSAGVPYRLAHVELTNGSTSAANGGAALESSADGSVDTVTFTDNVSTVGPGGAVSVVSGNLQMANVTFVGNQAPSGGDLATVAGFVTLKHATLWQANGGSLFNDDISGGGISLYNSAVSSTSGDNCTGAVNTQAVVASDASCFALIEADPMFGSLADHGGDVRTVDLALISPAVDAADTDLCVATDARGISRPQGGRCDAGAFEIEAVTTPVTFTVDDLGDTPDVNPGDSVCATAAATCTLRAAVDEANAMSTPVPLMAPDVTVDFSLDGTITLGSTLDVTARVTIDGGTRRVALSGGGAVRVLRFADTRWPYTLRHLTVRDGSTADFDGGAGLFTMTTGTIDGVTFTANANTAPGGFGQAGGGAVSVGGGNLTVLNTTFAANSVDPTAGGADLFVRGTATVTNSSFGHSTGGAVYSDDGWGASITLDNSIVSTTSGFACTGTINGSNNISADATPCGSGLTGTDPLYGTFGDHGGAVDTLPIGAASPAIDAADGGLCPAIDARGVTRPQGVGCDIGAYERDGSVTVTVGGTPNPSVLTGDVIVTATVTASDGGVPTGTLTFREGVTVFDTVALDGAGTASVTLSTLGVGDHLVVADYSGDANYEVDSATYTHQVTAPVTEVTVSAPVSVDIGSPVNLTVTVGAPGVAVLPTGTLTLREGVTVIDSATLGVGQTIFTIPAPTLGAHTYTVDYSGDGVYPAASGSGTTTVGAVAPTVLITSSGPTVYGQAATFNISVAGPSPTYVPSGTVTISDGPTELGTVTLDGSGNATSAISSLDVGTHTLTASYNGDTNYLEASGTASHVVDPASTSVTATSTDTVHGQDVTLTASVSAVAPGAGVPTGTVSFYEGVTLLGVGTLDGTGATSVTVAALATGTHNITVTYSGESRFDASAGSLNHVVNRASTTLSVTSLVDPLVSGQATTLRATVSAVAPGAGIPAGTISFSDGVTSLGTVTLDAAGIADLAGVSLGAGTHTISVTYSGTADFDGSTGSNPVTVAKATVAMVVDPPPAPTVTGEPATFMISLTAVSPGAGTPTGTVTVFDGATPLGSAVLDGSGSAGITLTSLPPGLTTLTVDYEGDGEFAVASTTVDHVVDPASTSVVVTSSDDPSVLGQAVTLTATVTAVAPGSGVPTGTVTFSEGLDVLGSAAVDAGGVVSLTTTNLSVGAHTITASYAGGSAFLASSGSVGQTVDPAGSSVTLGADSATTAWGEAVTFSAAVAAVPAGPTPSGTVTFNEGATTLATVTLDGSANASVTLADLSVGTHAITAVYLGDGTVGSGVSAELSHTVVKADSTTSATSASPSVSGQSVTLLAQVDVTAPGAGTATGTVVFAEGVTVVGTATLDGTGAGSISVSDLSVGTHVISATYSGDSSVNPSVGSVSQVVDVAQSSVVLSSSPGPSVLGGPVTLQASVAVVAPGVGSPTGTVTFNEGVTVLGTAPVDGSGSAALDVSTLGVGTHSITANYSGDGATAASSGSGTHVVTAAQSVVVAGTSGSPSVVGEPVTFTASVSVVFPGAAPIAGTVTFRNGPTALGTAPLDGSGAAALVVSDLGPGSHSITATYDGSSDLAASTSEPVNQTVDQAGSTVIVSASQPSGAWGETVTLSATVSVVAPGVADPTGTVTFAVGAVVLGTATLNPTATATLASNFADVGVGTHTVTATYNGDANLAGSVATTTQSVTPALTVASATSATNPSALGQPVVIDVIVDAPAVSPAPTGSVQILDGATVVATASLGVSGAASVSVNGLAVGSHTLVARYTGSASFAPADSPSINQVVSVAGSTVSVVVDPTTSVSGQQVAITAVVDSIPSGTIPTGSVTFMDGATVLGSALIDGTGTAVFSYPLGVGTHSILASYAGDASVGPGVSATLDHMVTQASTSAALSVSPTGAVSGQLLQVSADVTVVAPGAANPSGTMTFTEGATVLGSATVDGSGRATIDAHFGAGTHTIVATYSGDAALAGSTASTDVSVAPVTSTLAVGVAPDPVPFGVNPTVTVSVTTPTGVVATGCVDVTIESQSTVCVGLDANGLASWSGPVLAPGTYSVDASYAGSAEVTASTAAPGVLNVAPGITAVGLTVSPAAVSTYGQSVVLTAMVPAAPGAPTPTGTVTFADGPATLGSATVAASGTATLAISTLGVGAHSIVATLASTNGYASAQSPAKSHTVTPAPTTTTLSASVNPAVTGQTVNLTAVVAAVAPGGGIPTGTVTFTDGAATIGTAPVSATGEATVSTSSLAVGSHAISASFHSSTTHSPSTSPSVDLVVDRASSSVVVSASQNPSVNGEAVDFSALVTVDAPGVATPTGTVTFKDTSDGSTYGPIALDGSGRATATIIPAGSGGAISVEATYSGDAALGGSVGSVLQQVDAAPTATVVSTNPISPVAGDEVAITATVTSLAPSTRTPTFGDVTFSDNGDVIATVPVGTDGRATIYRPQGDLMAVGVHQLDASYSGMPGRFTASSGTVNRTVVRAMPTMTLTAQPTAPAVGDPVTLTATFTRPVTLPVPGESITFRNGATLLGSAPLVVDSGVLEATLVVPGLALGNHTLSASFPGNGSLEPVTAQTTVEVGAVPTTMALVDFNGGYPGMDTTFVAYVQTDGSVVPSGSVSFTEGATVLAVVHVTPDSTPGWSVATLTRSWPIPGSHEITATYLPNPGFAPSSASLMKVIEPYEMNMSLAVEASVQWGNFLPVTVGVDPGGVTPAIGATGVIVVDNADGSTCTVSVSGGTCSLYMANPGVQTLSATYAGSPAWSPASTSREIDVFKRVPTLSAAVHQTPVVTGDPFRVNWRLSGGPTSPTVSVHTPGGPSCSAMVADGGCNITLAVADVSQSLTVTFAGDDRYLAVQTTVPVTPVGCYPLSAGVSPSDTGTIAVGLAPSCNGGTGYPDGTYVPIVVTPAAGYRIAGRNTGPVQMGFVAGTPARGGTGSLVVQTQPLYSCAAFTVTTEEIGDASGVSSVYETPNCVTDALGFSIPGEGSWKADPYFGPSARTGQFLVGTTVPFMLEATAGKVYGIRPGGPGTPMVSVPPATGTRFRGEISVNADKVMTGVFGPACMSVSTAAVGSGTVSVDTPTNCQDPDRRGWLDGTRLTFTARSGPSGFVDTWNINDSPYGDGSNFTANNVTSTDAAGVITANATYSYTVNKPSTQLTATFGSCARLTVNQTGYGSVVADPKGNCPSIPGNAWKTGTQITLTTTGGTDPRTGQYYMFDGWTPISPFEWRVEHYSTTLVMDRDRTVSPYFYPAGVCGMLTVDIEPTGAGSITSPGLDESNCPARGLSATVTERTTGLYELGFPVQFEAQPTTGNPMVGWTVPDYDRQGIQVGKVSLPGSQVHVGLNGNATITAQFCQGIDMTVNLVGPDGVERRERLSDDSDFIMVDTAPNCPYADRAWLVGTTVHVAALADPVGYGFQNWSGASTATTLGTSVTLDGASPTVSLEATYKVTCFTLVTNPGDRVRRSPEPNCPGIAASDGRYIGGTVVVLMGDQPSDTVFQGWSGDVDRPGEVGVTWVTMDADKTANFDYRDKDVWETIGGGFDWFGNQVAITAKKAAGVLAAAAGTFISNAPPMGYLTAVVGIGSAIDALFGLFGMDLGISQYLEYAQQTVTWLMSGYSCAAVWGLSSSGTTPVDDDLVGKVGAVAGQMPIDRGYRASNISTTTRQLEALEASRTYAAVGPATAGANVTIKETTSTITKAKIGYKKLKRGYNQLQSSKVAKVARAADLGVELYNIIDGEPGVGWDSDANSAWTNGDAYKTCALSSVPDYMGLPKQ